ncbi:hypothetical protein Skr01_57900 [Sphaerisporangium krabiense]|nr:hypothetical protein Skr01_57900 [Sphaerisporangium krabiense]
MSSTASRILITGSGTYGPGSRLTSLPAVPTTVADLADCLTSLAGTAPENISTSVDAPTPAEFAAVLRSASRDASDVFLFYYVGHGLISPAGELHLATAATMDLTEGAAGYQALPYSVVREVLSQCPARLIVIILDCCFSGLADGDVGGGAADAFTGARWEGAYLLTATNSYESAYAEPGARHTAFSGAFIRLLTEGDPAAPAALTIDDVYDCLVRKLDGTGLPAPRRQAADRIDRRPLVENAAYRPPEPDDPEDPDPAPGGERFSPYQGLSSFGPRDAPYFYGRQDLTRTLVERLARHAPGVGPLLVTGPSGSGKSSLLRAGLLPALGSADLGADVAWLYLTPGPDCVGRLARRLSPMAGMPEADARAAIVWEPGGLAETLAGTLRDRGRRRARPARLAVVVDQFEDVFTPAEEVGRDAFIRALCAICEAEQVSVVLGLRSDFFGHCAPYPELIEALKHAEVVPPMTGERLRAVIERPAARAGLVLEDGLTDLLLRDCGGMGKTATGPGGVLPLLSHALLATWQRRRRGVLTLAGYQATGGLAGALAQTADATVRRLGPSGEPIARRLLLRLVRLGEGTEDTRRKARLTDLMPSPADAGSAAARHVLAELVAARLVTVDDDTAEITHEALLRHWPRLRDWIDARRGDLLAYQQVSEDAATWRDRDRKPDYLYSGGRLEALASNRASWTAAFTGTPPRHDAPLNAPPLQDAPLHDRPLDDASLNDPRPDGPSLDGPPLHDVPLHELTEEFLAASEAAASRAARIRRGVIVSLVGLLLAALAGAGAAVRAAVQESEARGEVEAQKAAILSRQLSAKSDGLAVSDPRAAQLLAAAGWKFAHTPEARHSMLDALARPMRQTLTGHTAPVTQTAFSPDGHYLATASRDGTARLWDITTHRVLNPPLTGHAGAVWAIAFSPDGQTLATADGGQNGEDVTIRLWDTATRTLTGTLKGHTAPVYALAFDRDGVLASTGADQSVRLWDTTARVETGEPLTGSRPFTAVALSGDVVAAGDRSGEIRLWNRATGRAVGHPLRMRGEAVSSVALSTDGRTLAATDGGVTRLWRLDGRRAGRDLPGERALRESMTTSPGGEVVVNTGRGEDVELWDARTSRPLTPAFEWRSGLAGLTLSPDGRTLATLAGNDVQLWDVAILRQIDRPLTGHTVNGLAFGPDGTLATAGTDGTVHLWDVLHRRDVTIAGHEDRVRAVAFSPDGRTVTSAGDDNTVRLWDVATRRSLGVLARGGGSVVAVAFSSDGRTLAAASNDSTRLWDVATRTMIGEALSSRTGMVSGLAFRPDGRVLAVAVEDRVEMWDVATPRLLTTLAGQGLQSVTAIAFSPDGRLLAAASADGTVRLWDTRTYVQTLQPLVGHDKAVTAVAFGPSQGSPDRGEADAPLLATAGKDGTARLWDTATHQQIGPPLRGHHGTVWAVAFGSDRRRLATAGRDGTVRLWDVGLPAHPYAAICAITGRSLREDEWNQYLSGEPVQESCGTKSGS